MVFYLKRFIVTLGWILNKPLTLLFDPYESIAMFLAGNWFLSYLCMLIAYNHLFPVLTVNYVVQDGKSNWLEGFILMGMFSTLFHDCAMTYVSFRSISDFGGHLLVLPWFWYARKSYLSHGNNPDDSLSFSSCHKMYLTYLLLYTFIILESQFTLLYNVAL